jgi:alkylated DNA repair dioxygenase AlkB
MSSKQTITLTFSENVENHAGMQQITSSKVTNGYSVELLNKLASTIGGTIYNLNNLIEEVKTDEACLLVFQNGLETIFNISKDELYKEQSSLDVDKKAFMYGRVVNKAARYNLCFADFNQEPDYSNKKGRVIDFNTEYIPLTNQLRNQLGEKLGDEFKDLFAEGNYYYNVDKCYIGWHGDTERKCVLGVRLGEPFDLHYQWYYKNEKVGNPFSIQLNSGDIYIMSSKAVGFDWKSKNKYTLRHAAGNVKNL